MAKDIVIIPADGQIEFSGSSTHHNVLTVDSKSISITTDNFIIDGGNITAQKYIVSSSVTHMTQSFSSGSTTFGDDSTDSHTFIGDITASGHISMSGGGDLYVGDNLYVKDNILCDNIFHNDDTDTFITFGTNVIALNCGGNQRVTMGSNGAIWNNDGDDADFQIKSDDDDNIIFVDGGEDKVGIGTGAPSKKLTVAGDISASGKYYAAPDGHNTFDGFISASGTTGALGSTHIFGGVTENVGMGGNQKISIGVANANSASIHLHSANVNWEMATSKTATSGGLIFRYNGTGKHGFDNSGNFGVGTISPAKTLTVAGDISASGGFYVSSSGGVTLGTSYPTSWSSTSKNMLEIQNDSSGYARIALRNDGTGGSTYRMYSGSAIMASMYVVNQDKALKLQAPGGNIILDPGASSFVGIDTDDPTKKLTVEGDISASGHLYLQSTKKAYLNPVEDTYLDSDSTDRIRFVAGGQQMLVLDYDTGNRAAFGDTKVGIGAVGDNHLPSHELEVDGVISASGDLFVGSTTGTYFSASNGNVEVSGSGTAELIVSGTATIYTGSFDLIKLAASATISGAANTIYIPNLDVAGSGVFSGDVTVEGANLHIGSSGANQWELMSHNSGLLFRSASSAAMVIHDGDKNVSVGTADDSSKKFTVQGDISASGNYHGQKFYVRAYTYARSGDADVYYESTTPGANNSDTSGFTVASTSSLAYDKVMDGLNFIAHAPCTIEGFKAIGRSTLGETMQVTIWKGSLVNASNAGIALTEVAEYSQACSANTNYFFSGSITSNNALAENDFVMTTIKKSTDNGTAYLYYNGNLELRYT